MLYLTNRFHLAVCLSVIDHRWRQNVVRSEKWPTSRYNWTDARPNGIYLFYIIKKQKLIKAFLFRKKIQSRAVMGFSNSEKSDLTSFVIYTNMEQTDWLLGPATNWLAKEITPLSKLNRELRLSWNKTSQPKLKFDSECVT